MVYGMVYLMRCNKQASRKTDKQTDARRRRSSFGLSRNLFAHARTPSTTLPTYLLGCRVLNSTSSTTDAHHTLPAVQTYGRAIETAFVFQHFVSFTVTSPHRQKASI